MKASAILMSVFGFTAMVAASVPDPVVAIEPCDVSCGDKKRDAACEKEVKWTVFHPMDAYVHCIQGCRLHNGLPRLIYHKGRYLDMTLEQYDEFLNGGNETSKAETDSTATVTEIVTVAGNVASSGTITEWYNGTPLKSSTVSVPKTTTPPSASASTRSTGFKTVIRTVSHSAPQPSDEAFDSVVLAERSATENVSKHPCQKMSKQIACRTECMFTGLFRPKKCYLKCMKKCYNKHPLQHDGETAVDDLVQEPEIFNRTTVSQLSNSSVLEPRDAKGHNHDSHRCNDSSVERWCHFKAQWHWTKKTQDKHYNRCIKKCVRKHNGDNYGPPDDNDEGKTLIAKRAEVVADMIKDAIANLTTAGAPGSEFPCSDAYWQTICNSVQVWYDKNRSAYAECMRQCEEVQPHKEGGQ